MFSPYFVGGLLFGDSDRYNGITTPLALEMEHISIGTMLGDMEGRSLTGEFNRFF
jgi:hypothetical protein